MRLIGQRRVTWLNRAQFFGVAAQIMRRILVDHARERQAAKRPGGVRVTLDEGIAHGRRRSTASCSCWTTRCGSSRRIDERQAHIVELKYFGGLSEEEVAAVLSLSRATITREWQSARAWLYRRMTKGRIRAVMTNERSRWPRVKEIFHAALACAAGAAGGVSAGRVRRGRRAQRRRGIAARGARRRGVVCRGRRHRCARAPGCRLANGGVPALAAGTEFGPYRILGPLDAGGMGEVYRAFDTRLHREVAVKVLPAALSERSRARRAARAGSSPARGLEPSATSPRFTASKSQRRPARHRHGARRRADAGRSSRRRTVGARRGARDRAARLPMRSRLRTRKASSIAISSRPTSSSPRPGP